MGAKRLENLGFFFKFFLVTFTVNRYNWSEIKLALHCYMESNVLKYNYLGGKPPKFAIYETLSPLFSLYS